MPRFFRVIYNNGFVYWVIDVNDVADLGRLIEKATRLGSEGEKAKEIGRLMEKGDEFRSKHYRIECRIGIKYGFQDQMYFAIYRPIYKGSLSKSIAPVRGGKYDLQKALVQTGVTLDSVNDLMSRVDNMKYMEKYTIVDPNVGEIVLECRRKYRR